MQKGATALGGHSTGELVVRGLALTAAIGYFALLVVAWVLNGSAGYDGILRPAPHEVRPGRNFTVLEVEPGSPADQAGIRAGDVISGLDGLSMSLIGDVHQAYHNRRAGQIGQLNVGLPWPGRKVQFRLESRLASPSILLEMGVASLLGIAMMGVGAGVALLRPRLPAARLLLIFALALAINTAVDLWHWTQQNAFYALVSDWVVAAILTFGCAALLHLVFEFPGPAVAIPRVRRWIWLVYLAAVLVLPAAAAFHLQVDPAVLTGAATAVLLLASVAVGELNYRRPVTALARAQLGWVRWGLGVGATATVLTRIATLLVPDAVPAAVSTVVAAAWLAFPVSLGFAVLRYRLFEVDRIVRTSIVWGAAATVLLGCYLLLVVLLSHLAVSFLGPSMDRDPTASVVAALLVAVMVHPVRVRLQSLLDRYIRRQQFARAALLASAADFMTRPQPADKLANYLCRQVPRQLSLGGSWLAMPSGRARIFESDDGVLMPNVSLASSILIETLGDLSAPELLAPAEDLFAYVGMPTLCCTPAASAWYEAGARLIVPLRGSDGALLAVWALWAPNSGDLFEREDLDVFGRIGVLAALQLEREALRSAPRAGAGGPRSIETEALTAREAEVLMLLARGYSNRQIADELVIGVRTAETHVERILRKLRLDNRAQAIVWARDHQDLGAVR